MRKAKKKLKKKSVNMRVPEELSILADEIADDTGISKTDACRLIIRDFKKRKKMSNDPFDTSRIIRI